MPKVEPLSGIDAAWLAMEDPTNLMMVSGILTFSQRLTLRKLKKVLRERFVKFDRFRQRVVEPDIPFAAKPLMPAYWELADDFQLDDHVHRVRLPRPAGRKQLRALMSELMSTPLDFSRPLWQMHLIENLGAGSALVVRLHHCIADGMALLYVLLSIADSDPEGKSTKARVRPSNAAEDSAAGPAAGPLEALFQQVFSLTGRVTQITERIVKEGLESLSNPVHLLELAKEGADNALAVQKLFLRTDDPETVFRGELGVEKLAAWSDALPLSEVKQIKRALGGTVNDVLISAMTGGLRRYLQRRREPVENLTIRATVPVNLRQGEDGGKMGNRFGLVFLSLPVGISDTLERLKIVSRRMSKLKGSREAPVVYGLLSALGGMGKEIQQPLVNLVGAKATAVVTNMVGPPGPCYLAGCQIDEIMFWVPQSARLGLGVSILSYNNKVRLGVATDASLVPDPERIVEAFEQEYRALCKLAGELAPASAEAREPREAASAEPSGSRPASRVPSRAEAARQALRRKRATVNEKPAAAPGGETRGKGPAAEGAPQRCRALTKKGARCRNRSAAGTAFCHIHRKQKSPRLASRKRPARPS